MSKSGNQLKAGALLSYVQMGLTILVGLIYTPLMVKALGTSEYGLYNTVSSTISILGLLSLGFSSGYVRYFSIYKKEGNEEKIHSLNGLFLIIFTIIGLIALTCGLWLSNNLHLVFSEGLTSSEYPTARTLMILLSFNLAITFPMSVFSSIVSANERYIFLKIPGILKNVCGPLITMPLLLLGYKSIALVTVSLCISVITDLLYFIYVKVVLKNRFVFHGFEKGLFKSLFIYTSFIAIMIIVDQINWNIDKMLLGRFKGTHAVAIYSVGYTIYQFYMTFSVGVSSVFIPRIHRIVNSTTEKSVERKHQLTTLFIKVGRIQFALLGLIASGLLFFGKPFIYYWAGEGFDDAYYVMLLLVFFSSIDLIQNLGIEVQRAQNKHKFASIVYLCMALINLVLSIFLCQKYGAIGSAVGTALGLLIANGFIMNIYYQKKCDINIILFWKNILRVSLGLIIPAITGVILMNYVDLYRIVNLILFIVIYTVVYCASMWFIGLNDFERNLIIKPVKKFFKKNNKEKDLQ